MQTVYIYLMETFSDWEVSNLMAELNSKRFFKKDSPNVTIKTVGLSKEPVRTMGGLTVVPDCTVDEISVSKDNMLVLVGSNTWNNAQHSKILEKAKKFLSIEAPLAAICGATVALASLGILDNRAHTSNGKGFLEMFCPNYKGTSFYVDEASVRDKNLFTAGSTGGLLMAKLILEYLDVFNRNTLESWYKYFSTGKAEYFFEMMNSLAG